jgi:hypothetical protein
MLHLLFEKKIVFLFLFVFLQFSLLSQGNQEGNNFRNFKGKNYYFGITLATNSSDYFVKNSDVFLQNTEISGINSIIGPGITVGIIGNLKIGDYFDFRLLPSFSFASKTINYLSTGGKEILVSQYDQTLFEMPFLIRYKSQPYKDVRLFVGTGVKFSHDISSNSNARRAVQVIRVAPSDFSFEMAAGMQIFFPYFILSPEIKYSHGMNNSLIYNSNLLQSTIIDRIQSRTFTISFHFEG